MGGAGVIVAENISMSFNGRPALNGVSLVLKPEEVIGLIGPSGGGKSILLKILGGVIAPQSGSLGYFVENKPRSYHDMSVGFLFQEGALFDSKSVIENVAFPMLEAASGNFGLVSEVSREDAYSRALLMLDEVGLRAAAEKHPGQLSGGMRRRVALARALVANPDLLLLDEPTGGLDPVASSVILELIAELHRLHKPTIVIVSHDLRRLIPRVERVIGLFDGEVVCDTEPSSMLDVCSGRVLSFVSSRYEFV
ncbi:MAG: ATP-binding cassette domain-containing protein [bacterium]|nr:ATP-binding cassette domain-containing protein [bacterium]